MLDTQRFMDGLIANGYSHLCVVPCSFAKNLINASINSSDAIEYVPCASEAVACSVAAGLRLAGKQPIVIVQSSGLTNMGSSITSLLLPYSIHFPIIVSWRTYKQGDSEIQHAHLADHLPQLIEAYGYRWQILDKNDEDYAVAQIVSTESEEKITILENKTFSDIELEDEYRLDLSALPPRSEYLSILDKQFGQGDWTVLGTTGATSREMHSVMQVTRHFYMAGNMGGALSLGTGAFLAGRDVVVCGGDAEFVMHMGGMTTLGRYQEKEGAGRLIYLLFDNQSNKSTGGQCTYQGHVDYAAIAAASGLDLLGDFDNTSEFSRMIEAFEPMAGKAYFAMVRCAFDPDMPRPPMDAVINSKLNFQ